jgi:hypothetical protein
LIKVDIASLGISSFTIKGQLFHGISSIQIATGFTPRFIPTYFFDTAEQTMMHTTFLDGGNAEDNARNLNLFQ